MRGTPLWSRTLVARDWSDLFITADGAASAVVTEDAEPEKRPRFFRRLRENMSKTRQALAAEVQATLFETLDDETWERLEEALIMADVGAKTTADVVQKLELEAEAVDVDGIVLTKLDGTAKGGIALAIAAELGIPVKLIGIGEQLDDLRPFDADDFARALLT